MYATEMPDANELQIPHRAMLIKLNKSLKTNSVYDAVRYAWKINLKRAEKAEVVLAVSAGEIVGVFKPENWMLATEANFPGRWKPNDDSGGRYGFEGTEASSEVVAMYHGKSVPMQYMKKGAAAPVYYTYK